MPKPKATREQKSLALTFLKGALAMATKMNTDGQLPARNLGMVKIATEAYEGEPASGRNMFPSPQAMADDLLGQIEELGVTPQVAPLYRLLVLSQRAVAGMKVPEVHKSVAESLQRTTSLSPSGMSGALTATLKQLTDGLDEAATSASFDDMKTYVGQMSRLAGVLKECANSGEQDVRDRYTAMAARLEQTSKTLSDAVLADYAAFGKNQEEKTTSEREKTNMTKSTPKSSTSQNNEAAEETAQPESGFMVSLKEIGENTAAVMANRRFRDFFTKLLTMALPSAKQSEFAALLEEALNSPIGEGAIGCAAGFAGPKIVSVIQGKSTPFYDRVFNRCFVMGGTTIGAAAGEEFWGLIKEFGPDLLGAVAEAAKGQNIAEAVSGAASSNSDGAAKKAAKQASAAASAAKA